MSMDERTSPTDPADEEFPAANDEPASPEPEGRSAEITPARRGLWAAGAAIGLYLMGRGVYGLVTGEDEQP